MIRFIKAIVRFIKDIDLLCDVYIEEVTDIRGY